MKLAPVIAFTALFIVISAIASIAMRASPIQVGLAFLVPWAMMLHLWYLVKRHADPREPDEDSRK